MICIIFHTSNCFKRLRTRFFTVHRRFNYVIIVSTDECKRPLRSRSYAEVTD